MTAITRESMKYIRTRLDAELARIGETLGVSLSLGNGRFDSSRGEFKLNVLPLSANGTVVDPKSVDFTRFATLFGLKPTDMGRSFTTMTGKTYTVCGLDRKAHKFPILARGTDGRTYKFPADVVRAILANNGRAAPPVEVDNLIS